jgi:hypothetical protein
MRLARSAAFLCAAVASTVVAIAPATAAPNPANTCPGAVKIENPADGSYAVEVAGRSGTIVLDVNEAASTFSFSSVGELNSWTSVIVKGGPGSLTYSFAPPVSSASGLHAPLNASSGTFYGLSHVCFFPASGGGGGGEE